MELDRLVERDERAVGASVRSFGHGCFTAQSGAALGYAGVVRTQWIGLAKPAIDRTPEASRQEQREHNSNGSERDEIPRTLARELPLYLEEDNRANDRTLERADPPMTTMKIISAENREST